MTHNYLGNPFLKNGKEIQIQDFTQYPVWGIYFSAHWCGPCRRFTPFLSKFYQDINKIKPFEVVYVSNDNSQEEFDQYTSMMPWLSSPYTERHRMDVLISICQPRHIPTLCIFNKNGDLITKNGVGDLGRLGNEAYELWASQS